MRKIKRFLTIALCFSTLISVLPAYAAESGVYARCNHTGVYITGERLTPDRVDNVYHRLKSQEVTRCVQCNAEISRGQIVMGDLELHSYSPDPYTPNLLKCVCGDIIRR